MMMAMNINQELKNLGWSSELIQLIERISDRVRSGAIDAPVQTGVSSISEATIDSNEICISASNESNSIFLNLPKRK